MAVYKDKNGTWYVSARYTNWKGEADRILMRSRWLSSAMRKRN